MPIFLKVCAGTILGIVVVSISDMYFDTEIENSVINTYKKLLGKPYYDRKLHKVVNTKR